MNLPDHEAFFLDMFADLEYPSVIVVDVIDFKVVGMNLTTSAFFRVRNPSDQPLVVQTLNVVVSDAHHRILGDIHGFSQSPFSADTSALSSETIVQPRKVRNLTVVLAKIVVVLFSVLLFDVCVIYLCASVPSSR